MGLKGSDRFRNSSECVHCALCFYHRCPLLPVPHHIQPLGGAPELLKMCRRWSCMFCDQPHLFVNTCLCGPKRWRAFSSHCTCICTSFLVVLLTPSTFRHKPTTNLLGTVLTDHPAATFLCSHCQYYAANLLCAAILVYCIPSAASDFPVIIFIYTALHT